MLERPAASGATPAARIEPALAPALPRWVQELFELPPATTTTGRFESSCRRARNLQLVHVVLRDAVSLTAPELREGTAAAYGELLATVSPDRALVRVWNFVPGILAPLGDSPHRYMVFNEGRHDAYASWYGSARSFPAHLATATGIGHEGTDLVIHALAAADPGLPIENPRQVPAYLYSRRYGPLPPCFARATLLERCDDDRPSLLVGGTSSVHGEDSAHPGDLAGQVEETLLNLEALLAQARRSGGLEQRLAPPPSTGLACFRDVRVYHPARVARPLLAALVETRFPRLESLEYVTADLCRPELLVEIEGLAKP